MVTELVMLPAQRRLDRALRRPDPHADVLVLLRHAGMAGDAVAVGVRRLHATGVEFAQLVRAARGQQEAADPSQRADRQPHLLHRLAPRRRLGRLAIVAEAGGQLHQHRIEAGHQRRQPELLDQHDRVRHRIIRQHRGGTAAPPHLPGLHAGRGAVEAAMAKAHDVEREAAAPDALLGAEFDIGMRGEGRERLRGTMRPA